MTTLYVCGPMTGLPEFNYPAFHHAARALREAGFEVENPAENQAPPCGSWAGYMRIAIAKLVRCDGIAHLPGWETSRGASIETRIAVDLNIARLPWQEWLTREVVW